MMKFLFESASTLYRSKTRKRLQKISKIAIAIRQNKT